MTNVNETTERRNEVQQGLKDYCTQRGINYTEFARTMGFSPAIILAIANGRWHAVSPKRVGMVFNKIKNATQVLKTNDCAAVFQLCSRARKYRLMVGLLADTGIGKTTSLTAMAASKNTFYVCYDKSMNAKQFFSAITREMTIGFDGNIHDMVNVMCDELNAIDEPLLIIDEASKLPHNILMYLQTVRDKTVKNCGIVLAGMPYFKDNLLKNVERNREGYGEFFRRVNLWHELEGLTKGEIEQICKMNGIKDDETIREFRQHKRFGDLINAIILDKTMNED